MLHAEPGVAVTWRAYELRPDPVPTLDPGGEYLRRVWTSSVYPLAASLGMKIRLPPVQPRSRLAHEAAHWARGQRRFDDYNAAVFRAFFENGADIGAEEVLVALAAELGLDGESLGAALASHHFQRAVLEDERDARFLGVNGVPAFIANRRALLSGVQPVENLRAFVAQVRKWENEA